MIAPDEFSAVLHDVFDLRELRRAVLAWLGTHGVDGHVGEAVVLATSEAAASAIEHSAGEVTVVGQLSDREVEIDVSAGIAWGSPEDDEAGLRMKLVRASMSSVAFDRERGTAHLRLAKLF